MLLEGGGGREVYKKKTINFLLLMHNTLRLLYENLKSIRVKLTKIWSFKSHQKDLISL